MNVQESLQEVDPLQHQRKYSKIATLGQGSFGFVQLARYRAEDTGREEFAAVKFLRRGAVNKYTEREIENHSQLRHPHIIQFKEVFLTPEYICIAMEYASGGSLFEYVQKRGRLKEAVARWFFQQLIIGVDYCHKRGIANRDIKLENTLVQMVHGLPLPLLKVCDFGYSKADFMSVAKSKVGTMTYMAPEVLVNRDGKYDGKKADIWSCGVMLYVMLYGRYPFESPTGDPTAPKAAEVLRMLTKMSNREYVTPPEVGVSADGLDLLRRMLWPNPTERITMEQILLHPWFLANLPPEAATMNEAYTGITSGTQPLHEIRRLLEEAKAGMRGTEHRNGGGAGAGGAGAGAAGTMLGGADTLDTCIEDTIREELARGGSCGGGEAGPMGKVHSGSAQTV